MNISRRKSIISIENIEKNIYLRQKFPTDFFHKTTQLAKSRENIDIRERENYMHNISIVIRFNYNC